MIKKKATNPRVTVLVITIGFSIIFMLTQRYWALWVAFSIGLLGFVSLYLAKVIDYLWMKLAHVLSFIVPNILLTLVFFVILFPVALLSRVFSKEDPLHLKNTSDSTFKKRVKSFEKASFEKTW